MQQALTKLREAVSHASDLTNAGTSTGLYIVGLGIREIAEAPLESLFIISQADKVFFLCHDKKAIQFLHRLNSSSEDLFRFYVPGKSQDSVYEDISNYILSKCDNDRVVFANYGNAFFLNSISRRIYNKAKDQNIPVFGYIAPSSIDSILGILMLDTQEHGFQCFLAGNLIRKRPQINTSIPLFIFQLSSIGEQKIYSKGRLPAEDVTRLRDFLQVMYPEEELWAFISCSTSYTDSHKIVVDKLKNLSLIAPIARNGTLVVGTNVISKAFSA